jgi:hypothetical protein
LKRYSPTGRRIHGRPLKRLLDTWDRNGSTSGPTPWQIYDNDDDKTLSCAGDNARWRADTTSSACTHFMRGKVMDKSKDFHCVRSSEQCQQPDEDITPYYDHCIMKYTAVLTTAAFNKNTFELQ